MHMGRERGVMRWDARHWMLSDRLEQVEARLTRLTRLTTPANPAEAPADAAPRMRSPKEERAVREEVARLTTEREDLRRQLRALGPSPRAKMG
ncbi:MAG TPA: hypothetical protein VMV29_17935 [Ktedonobacterales bacterium]|nr:hypothetical protein [Ktedonobacterales bacterium]HUY78657.1 hypothetical protein [Ktedonobacterales bacterium]